MIFFSTIKINFANAKKPNLPYRFEPYAKSTNASVSDLIKYIGK